MLPEKKKDILMSRGGSCIVLSGPPSPTGPTPAGRRNLQDLRATSQIYRKFRAPPTLHHFTRKNRHFTHFTALYTLYSTLHRVPSPLGPSYARSTQIIDVSRCLQLFWDLPSALFPPRALPPSSDCSGGGLPLPDRLSEHSHP